MIYWRDQYFLDLKDAAIQAAAQGWPEYADYCLQHEKGLRPRAMAVLDEFIRSTRGTSEAERRRFVSWLLSFADQRQGRDLLIPHPLQKQVVEPALLDWVQAEPDSPEPHRWLGGRDHLERALELDPADQIARRKLIVLLLGWVNYAAHELPTGYLGSAEEDLSLLEKIDALLPNLEDEKARSAYAETVFEERTAIQQYLKRSGLVPGE